MLNPVFAICDSGPIPLAPVCDFAQVQIDDEFVPIASTVGTGKQSKRPEGLPRQEASWSALCGKLYLSGGRLINLVNVYEPRTSDE